MAVTGVAKLAASVAKNGKSVVKIVGTATTVAAAAADLLDVAKPILNEVDTDALAAGAKEGAKGAASGVKKAGSALGSFTKGAAGNAAEKIGAVTGGIASKLEAAQSEKDEKKAIKETRQLVLENATSTIAAEDLKKKAGSLNDLPGCYLIATYKKHDHDKDLTDYVGFYVGKAEKVSEGIALAISKEGDADVYADIKYKQNTVIYIFNCTLEALDAKYEALITAFDDERLPGMAAGVVEGVARLLR